jgi:hypothetical protein
MKQIGTITSVGSAGKEIIAFGDAAQAERWRF